MLFSFYGFWQATHPPKFHTLQTPKDLGWQFEEVTITTSDGIKLAAWFVPSEKKTDQVIILLHGYPADKANLLNWAEFLHEDFNLFFFDFRYFGKSEGGQTTIGSSEQKDLQAAIEYLRERGLVKIGAMGFSMGGAVAILTAANPSADGLKAVVSDSAFANLDLMGYEFYRNLFVLKYPLTWFTKMWTWILLGIDVNQISPERAAQNLKIPILLIHSKADQTIPFENALRIQRALQNNPKAEFLFVSEGSHGYLPQTILEEYQKRVAEFFGENLK